MNIDKYAKKIWDYMILNQGIKKSDAIFALGSNDKRVAEEAGRLYLEGYAPRIIFSGGFGKDTHFSDPEAIVFAETVIKMGVPEDDVIIEDKATNTGENIEFTKSKIEKLGLGINSLILVHKPYMERRIYAAFKKQWPEVDFCITSPNLNYEEYWIEKGIEWRDKIINIMVGDLIRIKEYPKLGYQIEQDIPEDAWEAGQKLLNMGFDKYRI